VASKRKLVTVAIPLLYGSEWLERGTVLEMDAAFADRVAAKTPPFVLFGEHELKPVEAGDTADSDSVVIVFSPEDFPGAEQLAAVGIQNTDQLAAIMAEKGDNWFSGITGIGKTTAARIAAAMESKAPPVAKPAAKPAPKTEQKPAPAPKEQKPAEPAAATPAA